MNLARISKALLILAVLSLIVRKGIFLETFIPKPFETFLLLALIASFFYFFPKNLDKFKLIDKKIYLALFIFLFSIGLATLISYLRYGVGFNAEGVLNTIRFLIIIVTFVLFYIFFKQDEAFYKRVWRAFLSPVIFIPFLVFPKLAYEFSLVKGDGRFYGLFQNPSDASLFFLIALSFFFVLFLKNFYQKRKCFYLIYFSLTVTMTSLIFWSQSRAAWFAMAAGLIVASYLVIIALRKNLFKNLLLNIAFITLIFILSFAILPSSAKTLLILRAFPQYHNFFIERVDDIPQISFQNFTNILSRINKEKAAPDLFYDQPRLDIWKDYLNLIPKNPLGLGLNHHRPELALKLQGKPLGGYHNILLGCWIYGGITGLVAFLYLLGRVFLDVKNRIKDDYKSTLTVYYIAVTSALAGLIIHSLFGGLIFFYFFWILLAMALARKIPD